jgi:hypothetical protein
MQDLMARHIDLAFRGGDSTPLMQAASMSDRGYTGHLADIADAVLVTQNCCHCYRQVNQLPIERDRRGPSYRLDELTSRSCNRSLARCRSPAVLHAACGDHRSLGQPRQSQALCVPCEIFGSKRSNPIPEVGNA